MKKALTLLGLIVISIKVFAGQWQPSVAIVVDPATYEAIGNDIDRYAASIEKKGKTALIILDRWQHPDSIRSELQSLYRNGNLEGAVLIGDIPIPMIRDAQHFSTAFKMDQNRDWRQSSIPSDRLYDDFDLKLDYLRQDERKPLYHYYSLTWDSPQYIACDIYSARIKAPEVPGKTKHEALSEYLRKAVGAKDETDTVDKVLYFAGHGYNSDSFSARIDEGWVLKNHFPSLGSQRGGKLDFINFTRDKSVKNRLMAALCRQDMDIAILHHHGAWNTEYLNNIPPASDTRQYIEYTKRFFRSKIRSAKDTTASKQYYIVNYDVPPSWVEGAFDPETIAADSVFFASMDFTIPETYPYRYGARFVMLDACYNGSFHRDDYIAGHYIFNPGRTLTVKGNSVNTLQDIWSNELIGLLDEGVCIGNWAKRIFTLESHLMGDPTFAFSAAHPKMNLDREIVKQKRNPKYWRKLLGSGISDVKALAMSMLAADKAITHDELLSLLADDPDPVVRTEAFIQLKRYLSPLLTEAMALAMTDSYELLVRLGTLTAAKSGDPTLLPVLARMYFDPTTSERVVFQMKYGMDQYSSEELRETLEELRKDSPYWPAEESYRSFLKNFERSQASKKAEFVKLNDPGSDFKSSALTVRSQRNACQALYIDDLLTYLRSGSDDSGRKVVAETLGWFVYSYRKADILDGLRAQMARETNPEVKNEIQKSLNRLSPLF